MNVDPLAAAGADLAALVDAELRTLAVNAQALRDLLSAGTVVKATVLPSNGLTDLIEIAGLRVAASLPPNLRPGDIVQVQVTGFEGDQVQVQIVPSAASIRPSAPPQARASTPPVYGAPAFRVAKPPPVPDASPRPIEARLAAARAAFIPTAARPAAFAPAQRYAPAPPIAVKSPVVSIAAASPPRPSGLSAYTEPVALLRALRLPVTPSTVASATLALERPERLPDALSALESALPRVSDDPHVATARTLLAFVGKIEPASPVLATQIAAYVDHVVDGAEPKLVTLLAARRAAVAPHASPIPAAVASERAAVLETDLKQSLLAIARDPATPRSAAPALANAITALTAVQTTAAQLLAANPDGLAFTIPLATAFGTQNARISVKREAPEGGAVPADPANFRIAFILDTAHYGTVAIDLVTVGREVAIDVRAENARAMRAFRDALGSLSARLEVLRYRVASAEAKLASATTFGAAAPAAALTAGTTMVDRSA